LRVLVLRPDQPSVSTWQPRHCQLVTLVLPCSTYYYCRQPSMDVSALHGDPIFVPHNATREQAGACRKDNKSYPAECCMPWSSMQHMSGTANDAFHTRINTCMHVKLVSFDWMAAGHGDAAGSPGEECSPIHPSVAHRPAPALPCCCCFHHWGPSALRREGVGCSGQVQQDSIVLLNMDSSQRCASFIKCSRNCSNVMGLIRMHLCIRKFWLFQKLCCISC
jgi:hypothetical protein